MFMAESVIGWKRKWFYIKDHKASSEALGLPEFAADAPLQRLARWKHTTTDEEELEVALLVSKVEALRVESNLNGIQLMTTFVRRRVQPLCARPRGMWLYEGSSDSTRIVPTELSTSEIEKRVRVLTKFSSDDSPAYFPTAAAFSKDAPLPEVNFIRFLSLSSA
jgi:hypothetical protein